MSEQTGYFRPAEVVHSPKFSPHWKGRAVKVFHVAGGGQVNKDSATRSRISTERVSVAMRYVAENKRPKDRPKELGEQEKDVGGLKVRIEAKSKEHHQLLLLHNHNEVALEDFVGKEMAKPKSIVEIEPSHEARRAQLRTQGHVGASASHMSSLVMDFDHGIPSVRKTM